MLQEDDPHRQGIGQIIVHRIREDPQLPVLLVKKLRVPVGVGRRRIGQLDAVPLTPD